MYTRGPPERGIGAGTQANRGRMWRQAAEIHYTPARQSKAPGPVCRFAWRACDTGAAGLAQSAMSTCPRGAHIARAPATVVPPRETPLTRGAHHGGHIDRAWTRAKQRSAAVSQSSLILRPRDHSPSPGCLEVCWSGTAPAAEAQNRAPSLNAPVPFSPL